MRRYRVQWYVDGKPLGGLMEVDAVSVSFAAAQVKVLIGEEYNIDINEIRIRSVSTEKASMS